MVRWTRDIKQYDEWCRTEELHVQQLCQKLLQQGLPKAAARVSFDCSSWLFLLLVLFGFILAVCELVFNVDKAKLQHWCLACIYALSEPLLQLDHVV